jgi:hypothetical protein
MAHEIHFTNNALEMLGLDRTILESIPPTATSAAAAVPAAAATTSTADPKIVAAQPSRVDLPFAIRRRLDTFARFLASTTSALPDESFSDAKALVIVRWSMSRCNDDLQRLPLGSIEWLGRLRKGAVEDLVAHGVTLDDEMQAQILSIKLCLLSWETDQDEPKLPLLAFKHIEALRQLQIRSPHLTAFAVEVVEHFWTGVAGRFCDPTRLKQLEISTIAWELAPNARIQLIRRKTLKGCELQAVILLATPEHSGSLWSRSRPLFVKQLAKVLRALEELLFDSDSRDPAIFLINEIVAAAKQLLPPSFWAASQGNEPPDDPCMQKLKDVLFRATKAVESGECAGSNAQMQFLRNWKKMSLRCDENEDFLSDSVVRLLNKFDGVSSGAEIKDEMFDDVPDELWKLWIAELRDAEDYCKQTLNPSFRGVVGFSLYRDRYWKAVQVFGATYTRMMPQSNLNAALDTTPSLRTIMCPKEKVPTVWPFTVLTQNK